MGYTFEDNKPKEGQFWLIKTPKGMEGIILLYVDWDFGEAEVIKINAFELGSTYKHSEWIKLGECEFEGCVSSDIEYKPDSISGGYDIKVDKSDVDAAFTILEISNAL